MFIHGRSLADFDSKSIKALSLEKQIEFNESTKLGEKFKMDKEKIDRCIKEVQESCLAYEDKREIIVELETDIERLREQYNLEVNKKNNELVEYFQNEIKITQERIESLKKTILSIKDMKAETTKLDKDKMLSPIREKNDEFESLQRESKETLKSIIQIMEQQKRSIKKTIIKER